ncbi:hypothetical protein BC832DRAFT_532428 [Gaertneriomyces semiglobifer]|nr:hypothetical protein BC832DRAFT_532428 [Gaertneriomyces semiglobifer]
MSARRVGGSRISQRFQSTSTAQPAGGSTASHIAAGAAGGGLVLVGGYTYYRISGAKQWVDTATAAKDYYKDITVKAKQTIKEKTPDTAEEALESLRSITKSYASVIPGASSYIDSTFDSLDEIRSEHGEEFDKVITQTYKDVKQIIQDDKSGLDVVTGNRILDVMKRHAKEFKDLAKKAGKTAFSELEEKFPGVAQKLGGGYEEFQHLAAKAGPEAKKTLDEVSQQMHEIFNKGLTPDAYKQARDLIQSKSAQIKELAQKQSQAAWDKGLDQAKPYIDKVPELRQLLNDNSGKFVASAVSLTGASDTSFTKIFEQVKDIAEASNDQRKDKIAKFREFVQKKAGDSKDAGVATLERGWEGLQEWVKVVPGGSEALQQIPDVSVLVRLSQEKGDDAKELAKETYEDVLKILQEKAEKARKIVEDGKQKASKESKGR